MSENDKQDAEVMNMVRDGQQLPRKECRFIPEEEYLRLEELERYAKVKTEEWAQKEQDYQRLKVMERDAVLAAEEQLQKDRKQMQQQLLSVAIHLCAAPLFIGAGAEGLMDPIFAGIAAVGCVFWAACGVRWRWQRA